MTLPIQENREGVVVCSALVGDTNKSRASHAESARWGVGGVPTTANQLHFRSGNTSEAVGLVMRYHYSGRAPVNVQFVGTFHLDGGLFGDFGEAIAAIFFSVPPSRWSEDVWELSRLVRIEACRVPLTRLISLACKQCVKAGQDLLVSFADAAEGHHGGVYQAAGWKYDGQRDSRLDGLIINGAFVPGRTCNSIYGTQSPDKLRAKHPEWSIEAHYDVGKHLYWRALNRNGEAKAKRLELRSASYPKPAGRAAGAGVGDENGESKSGACSPTDQAER